MAITIDQISVQKASGWNLMTVKEWSVLGAVDRLQLLTAKKVKFLSDGEIVPAREALKLMRA